jgi:transcriptional regulator with XRE-family HTH domain
MVKVRKSHIVKKSQKKPKNVVGAVVRKLRLAAQPRITQDDLVARLEVKGLHLDRTSLLRIECGDRKITDIEMLAIAAALRVPVTQLFEGRGK